MPTENMKYSKYHWQLMCDALIKTVKKARKQHHTLQTQHAAVSRIDHEFLALVGTWETMCGNENHSVSGHPPAEIPMNATVILDED